MHRARIRFVPRMRGGVPRSPGPSRGRPGGSFLPEGRRGRPVSRSSAAGRSPCAPGRRAPSWGEPIVFTNRMRPRAVDDPEAGRRHPEDRLVEAIRMSHATAISSPSRRKAKPFSIAITGAGERLRSPGSCRRTGAGEEDLGLAAPPRRDLCVECRVPRAERLAPTPPAG